MKIRLPTFLQTFDEWKSWYDSRHPDRHSADWGDIAADAVGAVSAEGVVWLIHKEW